MQKTFISIGILGLIFFATNTNSENSRRQLETHNNTIHRIEDISGDGSRRYILEWEVNFNTQLISFQVTVATTGFVGFGISPWGGMLLADIVVGGVFPNGTTYFTDRFGTAAAGRPKVDDEQNWTLESGFENSTHTILNFHRFLDTGDAEEDVGITETAGAVIWSYGKTDTLEYHYENRRSLELNLLAPE